MLEIGDVPNAATRDNATPAAIKMIPSNNKQNRFNMN